MKETTETRLKTLLSEIGDLKGKMSGIVAEAERLKEQRNRELSGELVASLRGFSEAFNGKPLKIYNEILVCLGALQENDAGYFNKFSDKGNPYRLEFKDKDEEKFITGLLGNCLKGSQPFSKFIAYISSRAGKAGNLFFRKEGE